MNRRLVLTACTLAVLAAGARPTLADNAAPNTGTHTLATPYKFDVLAKRLETAIEANGMGLVATASASRGAAARSIKIPGNAVFLVFRNDYAVRMLAESVPAGIEAPLRIYLTENDDGTASITYRTPSAVFAPYGNTRLDALAKELDPIFERIVAGAGR